MANFSLAVERIIFGFMIGLYCGYVFFEYMNPSIGAIRSGQCYCIGSASDFNP